MKRVIELVWALVCAWMIHGIYTASKERAAAGPKLEVAPNGSAPAPSEEQLATEERPGSSADWGALFSAAAVLVASIIAVVLIDPREFTRDNYLAAVAAVAGLTGLVLGISKIVERFQPESRFFATFERCMLLIAVLWASVAALAAAQVG